MVAIRGRFDGKVIIPDHPVNLPENTRVRILIDPERVEAGTRGIDSLKFAGTIDSDSIREMSEAIEQSCEKVDVNEW